MRRNDKLATFTGSLLGLLSALLALSLLGHASDRQREGALTEELHKTYSLSTNGRIDLENMNGSVVIKTWDRNEVQVDAIKRASTKERLDEAQIQIDSHADALSIRTRYPDRDHTNWTSKLHNNPASVEYTLTVPRNARLDKIDLINGDFTVEGVAGEVRASCINGHLLAENLGGAARLSTVNGSLDARFTRLNNEGIELSSVNGSLRLTIPSDSQAQVSASTMSGSISDDFGLHVARHSFIGQNLHAQLGSGSVPIKLANVNGSIEIRHGNDSRTLSPSKDLSRDKDDDNDDDQI
jgi:DUF4097 and DUF4098 domain-containing protein YvlB